MTIQILLTAYVVPTSQAISRSIIKNSSVDFFESFVKPKKFNDNIKNLTIYADEKDKDGNLKHIYLKKDSGNKKRARSGGRTKRGGANVNRRRPGC